MRAVPYKPPAMFQINPSKIEEKNEKQIMWVYPH